MNVFLERQRFGFSHHKVFVSQVAQAVVHRTHGDHELAVGLGIGWIERCFGGANNRDLDIRLHCNRSDSIRYQVEMKVIEYARWLLSARRVWTADSESNEFNRIKQKPKEGE